MGSRSLSECGCRCKVQRMQLPMSTHVLNLTDYFARDTNIVTTDYVLSLGEICNTLSLSKNETAFFGFQHSLER